MSAEIQTSDASTPLPDDHWVVILLDPDWADWSPWSVRAANEQAAIEQAIADWHAWLEDDLEDDGDEAHEDPEVIKVYRNSWIGERV